MRQELKVNKKPHSYPLEQIRNQLKVLKLPEKKHIWIKAPHHTAILRADTQSTQAPATQGYPYNPPHRVILGADIQPT